MPDSQQHWHGSGTGVRWR
jgi:hypothetical protein